nr:cell division protein CrgA [Nesterenkonia sp. Act20]
MARRPGPAPRVLGCGNRIPNRGQCEIQRSRIDVAESKQRRNRRKNEKTAAKKSPLNDAEPMELKDLELEDESLPMWYRVTMIGLMILGLLWLIVWYITQGAFPIQSVGGWNVVIGFGIIMIGFFMTMRWK